MEYTSLAICRRGTYLWTLPLCLLLLAAVTNRLVQNQSAATAPIVQSAAPSEIRARQVFVINLLDELTQRARGTHGTTTVTTSEIQSIRQYVTLPHQ